MRCILLKSTIYLSVIALSANALSAKEWRGIVPLVSTRSQAKILLGAPRQSSQWSSYYILYAQTASPPRPSVSTSSAISELGSTIRTADGLGVAKLPKSLKHLSLTIDRHPGWMGDNYEEGDPIRIRCIFRNNGRSSLSFRLADHDSYHGTRPYPFGMRVRVRNLAGVVLSASQEFGEWWTQYYLSSGVYLEMPGDRITLKPGEQVVRIVPLDEMLLGNQALGKMIAGEYIVEMEIEGIVSNKMKLKVVKKP